MKNTLITLYEGIVFKFWKTTLLIAVLLLVAVAQYAGNFRLDASSDTLVLENDSSLKYFREVVAKYNTAEILLVTYSPKPDAGDLFSDVILDDLELLRGKLLELENTASIMSILDVPLTQSPPVTLAQLNGKQQTLRAPETDIAMAKIELRDSQLYRDLLLSDDYSTTAIIISLQTNPEVSALLDQRNALRALRGTEGWSAEQQQELERITLEHQSKAAAFQLQQDQYIKDIREVIDEHQAMATIFLGGLPMIVTDSIRYIEDDVAVFGLAALVVIIIILALAFRQLGWVVMPLAVCFTSGFLMVCLLGLLNWPISVVSSNFLSLLLIITLSLNIHLIVRYRELSKLHPEADQRTLLIQTIRSKFIACLYTALTTAVAFASLIVSGIRPVIDFGYIMCLGILVSMVCTFLLFPTLGLLMRKRTTAANRDALSKVILAGAESAYRQKSVATVLFIGAVTAAAFGLANLTVENRFIDYFKSDTEIYQGMHEIDEKLGGTTPLNIIIDAPQSFFSEREAQAERRAKQLAAAQNSDTGAASDFDDFDDFDDSMAESESSTDSGYDDDFEESLGRMADLGDADFDDFETTNKNSPDSNLAYSSYWYNEDGINKLKKIHDDLEDFDETGKVLSLATTMSLFENLKDSGPMDDIDLGFLYNVLSQEIKNTLLVPYLSADGNQTHISIRVFESHKGLNRNQLIADIRSMLVNEHGLADEQVKISGMLVLYNNMLNSLFESQILTLGTVFLAIMLMFWALFRSLKLALITIVPNLFSAGVVLGIMGLFSIPLDLMTITIAAITVGIAVDNAIHYVSRYRDERLASKTAAAAIDLAKNNVGQAMFYTTLTITAGFLIMVFSNFVPTMYFGILTALAMVTALVANLVMLPMLLAKFEP